MGVYLWCVCACACVCGVCVCLCACVFVVGKGKKHIINPDVNEEGLKTKSIRD